MNHALGGFAHGAAVLEGEQAQPVQILTLDLHGVKDDVVLNGLVQKQAHALAVLGHHGDAGAQGVSGVAQLEFFPKQGHAAPRVVQAHHAVGNAQLALAGQSADSQDLALIHLQRYAAHLLARHIHMQVPDAHGHPVLRGRAGRGLHHALSLAADHQLRKFHNAGMRFFARGGQLAIAQYRDRISGGHHLVQTVSDKDDGDAVRSNLFHHGDQLRGLALGQHRRGLVKHKQLYAGLINFAGNFDKLHIAHRHALDQRVLVDAHAHAVQRLAGVGSHGLHVQGFQIFSKDAANKIGMRDFTVELDILRDGKARQKHEFLVHHADALHHGVMRRGHVRRLALQKHLALEAARGMNHGHAKQHVHQRALSGAVFAQQRMDFARTHRQRNVAQDSVLAIALGDVFHFQYILGAQVDRTSLQIRRRGPPRGEGGPHLTDFCTNDYR